MFYYETKSRGSLMKEIAWQKAKIDDDFKAEPNQNQNEKSTFESDLSNNTIFKDLKTPIKMKARFSMNQSSKKWKKFRKILDNEAMQKIMWSCKEKNENNLGIS